ncbi:hypothetical protein NT239_04150 [Chitinibacter sp. SCUT-21]|uniref:hypothetical protein n=1 Tax=Chitinibacter sp. SCUT-21 TaxID=2970891 RepID=UPI0035A634FB
MASVLPHPESLFLSPSERGLSSPEVIEKPKAAPTITDKINRLKQKRQLASDLQAMIAKSGLSIEELREALRGQ